VVTLIYSTAATKPVVNEKPSEAPDSTPEPRLSVEERLTKAFAGLCSPNELSALNLDGIITNADYDQLLAERRYIEEISPFERRIAVKKK
jgi:hypothetical protein